MLMEMETSQGKYSDNKKKTHQGLQSVNLVSDNEDHMPKTRNEEKNANSCCSVVRAELDQGMARTGQFSQQESKVVFELADIDGNGN